jgi:hypothetical protein
MNEDKTNMNDWCIQTDGATDEPLRDASAQASSVEVRAHFRDLGARLVDFIHGSPAVVGSVAWLTHGGVLSALASVPASVLVAKEDFLKPDGVMWKARLRRQYDAIGGIPRQFLPGLPSELSFASEENADAVRCVGNAPTKSASPRMHNKFF